MSKIVKYECELKNVDENILKKAMDKMSKELDIKVVGKKLYLPNSSHPISISIKDGHIILKSDNMYHAESKFRSYEDTLKQFYEAVYLSQQLNIPEESIEYNRQTEELTLTRDEF